jgi:hypothetical protein
MIMTVAPPGLCATMGVLANGSPQVHAVVVSALLAWAFGMILGFALAITTGHCVPIVG